ncbi:MAG: hypothetical protein JNM17_02965, partial [Archangium sp.]|nr:hypothetical protein [Archangium sp.]
TVVAQSLDFRVMIHKIHAGTSLSQPYVLGGNPTPTTSNPGGTPLNFGLTRFPRPLTECESCHRSGTAALVAGPRAPSILQELTCLEDPGADTDTYCTGPNWVVSQTTQLAPQTSVCTSCHDRPSARAHAWLNTTPMGEEACESCHGAGRTFDAHPQ